MRYSPVILVGEQKVNTEQFKVYSRDYLVLSTVLSGLNDSFRMEYVSVCFYFDPFRFLICFLDPVSLIDAIREINSFLNISFISPGSSPY